jgi:hypothetical protein
MTLPNTDSYLSITLEKTEFNFVFLQKSEKAKESKLEKGLRITLEAFC